MFEKYIDQLAEDVDGMADYEVRESYEAHKGQPKVGFENYIERNLDTSQFPTVEQLESHCEQIWDEFDASIVSATYEERLTRLYNKLNVELLFDDSKEEKKRPKI